METSLITHMMGRLSTDDLAHAVQTMANRAGRGLHAMEADRVFHA